MIKPLVRAVALLGIALSPAALGFAFSDYVEDDSKLYPDPLASWLDRGASSLCLTGLSATVDTVIHWLSLQYNPQPQPLPLFRSQWQLAPLASLTSADCLYQKTVLRFATQFPEIALSQPYFFKCASDDIVVRGKRLQFALEPIDEVRFKLHLPPEWPQLAAAKSSAKAESSSFSTTILQQTDASRCQAR